MAISSSRSTASASSAALPATVQAGWWCSWRATIPIASGRCPHSPVISSTPGSSGLRPAPPASCTSSAAASPGGKVSRLTAVASSSAVKWRRLVTSTRLPAEPGSSGRTCSLSAASSSRSSSCLPTTRSRHSAIRASSPDGICPGGSPAVSSRLASASAGSTGRCPGVCPCSGKKICPSGNRGASRWAAWTASAVLPMPAIPPIAWILTTPGCEQADVTPSSCRNSGCRPVNEAMSRGRVRVAAAVPPAVPAVSSPRDWDTPMTARPRATASNDDRAVPVRFNASASSRAVSFRAVSATPRSRSLTVRTPTPAVSASSSWDRPASVRNCRNSPANATTGGSTATTPSRHHPRHSHCRCNQPASEKPCTNGNYRLRPPPPRASPGPFWRIGAGTVGYPVGFLHGDRLIHGRTLPVRLREGEKTMATQTQPSISGGSAGSGGGKAWRGLPVHENVRRAAIGSGAVLTAIAKRKGNS